VYVPLPVFKIPSSQTNRLDHITLRGAWRRYIWVSG